MEEKKSPLEDVIKNIITGLDRKGHLSEEEIAKVWGDAAGKPAAKHSKPVSFKKATLIVNVDGSSWLYELTTKKREILRKLEGNLKGKSIRDIRFRIGDVKK